MGLFNKKSDSHSAVEEQCAEYILSYSARLSSALRGDRKVSDTDNLLLFFSAIALNYILLDRMAFDKMSENDRNNFCDLVLLHMQVKLAADFGLDKELISNTIDSNVQMLAPHSRRLFPDNVKDGMKGTLFWEYGKMIGEGFDFAPQVVLEAPLLAMQNSTTFMQDIAEILNLEN